MHASLAPRLTLWDPAGIWPAFTASNRGNPLSLDARTLRPGDGHYPERLARLAEAPGQLRVRGELGTAACSVALVGARATDEYGELLARDLAAGLARAGVSVVSGGAVGVDAAAHRGALEAGGHTVAVLGTGVDVVYPRQHRALFEGILETGGALVSELPDGSPGLPRHFPARNRIIAALADAVVVVRARPGSGSLITASWARAQGVKVFAVPGDVRDALSAGPLALLREGAGVASSAADVLAGLGLAAAAPVQAPLPALDDRGTALLRALGRRPRHADELAREAGIPVGAALAGLLTLELEGLCEQRPGHYFLRRSREGI
ncbi:DNA protecting protein DprA [Anaeromyxobacter dehalogenans 2CP-1]|uniref:DNA protecting protein DprA n=1 Tax=Anaeromyxobacter dehalogenans (strain ATCC BAA-258 / DSM 21875 / 2CP-1) TaxID=455488 RepID=B8JES7_ANAD2|nr:DNA protecting protein DprA [Anaeromyxobacter dehalogenans 2CP-1]